MEKKITTLIEEEVFKQAKRLAVKEGRPLSHVIQDALVSYLSDRLPVPKKREDAYQLFCKRPMRISREQFMEIIGNEANTL